MAVNALEDYLGAIDIHTVVLADFNCTETKFLALYMQRLAIMVFQSKHSGVHIRCFCSPQGRTLHSKVYICHIRSHCKLTAANFLAFAVDNIHLHLCSLNGTVQIAVGLESSVHAGVDSHTMNVLSWF